MIALFLALSAQPAPLVLAQAGGEVDVELVLAVDISGSMDIEEARIQRSGYIAALRHPDFINAVRGGLTGRIALSYFEWAGSVDETSVVNWEIIGTADDAERFAATLEARPVRTRRGTSISNAIGFAQGMIAANTLNGLRQVIDVSGDGPNNTGPPVVPARDGAIAAGLVINGLAIKIRPSGSFGPLDRYYADCVIGGPGSFVLPVQQPADFASAIRQKLILEISGIAPPASVIPVQIAPPSDCMIGEKLRPQWLDR